MFVYVAQFFFSKKIEGSRRRPLETHMSSLLFAMMMDGIRSGGENWFEFMRNGDTELFAAGFINSKRLSVFWCNFS